MVRDRLPSSDESEPEDEDLEEEDDERVAAGVVNPDMEEDEEGEGEGEEPEPEPEEESSEKTASPARGLDYESDDDSGESVPTPSALDFIVKKNPKVEAKEKKARKRSAESDQLKEKSEAKKSKKEKAEKVVVAAAEVDLVAEDKGRKSPGLRIWGPEDELMILTGMMDYKEEMGVDFNSNLDSFYKYIKGKLNVAVDKSQLINKIRKLKKKFRDNAAKEANGEPPLFSKSHEADVYEFSKKVWDGKAAAQSKSKIKKDKGVATDTPGLEVDNVLALPVPDIEMSKEVNGGSAKAASSVRKVGKKPNVVHKMEFMEPDVEMKDSVIPMPAMVEGVVFEKGLELVEKSKVDALNKKWTKYQMDAAELYVRRLDLIKEQTKLILDALKSNP